MADNFTRNWPTSAWPEIDPAELDPAELTEIDFSRFTRDEDLDVRFEPESLDERLLATHFEQHGLFLGHVVGPAANDDGLWDVAIFVTGWGPIEDVALAEFYMGRGWSSDVLPVTAADDGSFGLVVRSYDGFLVLCRLTLESGDHVLLEHYCNLGPGDGRPNPRLWNKRSLH